MTPPRDDDVTTSAVIIPAPTASCPTCGFAFVRVGRQRYCSPACRQRAYRARQPLPAAVEAITGLARSRRDTTVYACPDCEQRYHGLQWCHDCNRPCRRLGPGGPCPHCQEPVTVDDLLSDPPR